MNTHTKTNTRTLPSEPDAHVVAQHFRTGVRWLLGLSLLATIACMFFFRDAAYVAAIPIPILYGVLAYANYLEFRSRRSNLRTEGSTKLSREELEVDVETIGIITLMKVLGVLAIGTFIIAAALFQWQAVGAGAIGLFFLMLLIQSPFLPLYFSESERDELEKLKRDRH